MTGLWQVDSFLLMTLSCRWLTFDSFLLMTSSCRWLALDGSTVSFRWHHHVDDWTMTSRHEDILSMTVVWLADSFLLIMSSYWWLAYEGPTASFCYFVCFAFCHYYTIVMVHCKQKPDSFLSDFVFTVLMTNMLYYVYGDGYFRYYHILRFILCFYFYSAASIKLTRAITSSSDVPVFRTYSISGHTQSLPGSALRKTCTELPRRHTLNISIGSVHE